VLIDTIRQDLGIPVNHYIEVNFRGFQSIIDTLGGVPYYASTSLRDSNTGLNLTGPQCMTLNGTQALALARSRHLTYLDSAGQWTADPTSDIGRMVRQQMIVRAVAKQALRLNLTDAVTAYRLLDAAVHSLTVDQTIGRTELLNLAKRFQHLNTSGITGVSVPTRPHTTAAGADVLLLDSAQARTVLNPFRGLPADAMNESDVEVSVVSTSRAAGTTLLSQLRSAGFTTALASTRATATSGVPIIRYGRNSELAAQLVAQHLDTAVDFRSDSNLGPNQVTLVRGSRPVNVLQTRTATVPSVPTPESTQNAAAPLSSTPTVTATVGVPPAGAPSCRSG
jgi:LCP family protein required for cell wall assembly